MGYTLGAELNAQTVLDSSVAVICLGGELGRLGGREKSGGMIGCWISGFPALLVGS